MILKSNLKQYRFYFLLVFITLSLISNNYLDCREDFKKNSKNSTINFPQNGIPKSNFDNNGINKNIFNVSEEKTFGGFNLFILNQFNATDPENNYQRIMITDMTGKEIMGRNINAHEHWPIEFINSTTLLYADGGKVALWNIYSNHTQYIDFIGHHDFEYNPISQTFFTFKTNYVEIDHQTYVFDILCEYNWSGDLIWELNMQDFISIDQYCSFNDRAQLNYYDLTHSNTIFYDTEDDIIYFNTRNTNTFYKINHTSKEVIWGLGEFGDFTLYDRQGNIKESLFYHAHAVEKVDANTFILFDNDLHNISCETSGIYSRILEITINETTKIATETWSWIGPEDYSSTYWGDADRLPNFNRLGTFGTPNHQNNINNIGPRLVEVNSLGEICWELNIPSTSDYFYGIYRCERFRYEPTLTSPDDIISVIDEDVNVNWGTWYNFRTKQQVNGTFSLLLNGTLIESGIHTFDKFWRQRNCSFILKDLPIGTYNLTLVLADEAGHSTEDSINLTIAEFYIERNGPIEIEKGIPESTISWTGKTAISLSYNLSVNNEIVSSEPWNNNSILLDLNTLYSGSNNISLILFNSSEILYDDSFLTMIYPQNSPIFISSPNIQYLHWNNRTVLQWKINDQSPEEWKIYVNSTLMYKETWKNPFFLINWSIPLLNEGTYNITVEIYDKLGNSEQLTHIIAIIPPLNPIISNTPNNIEIEWGKERSSISWEIHGGYKWTLIRNGSIYKSGFITTNFLQLEITDWQVEKWSLGTHNITLEVKNEAGNSSISTMWIKIWIKSGDPFADKFEEHISLWNIDGNNACGAPDGIYSEIYQDYGNGYIILDMGESEEILDGLQEDFTVYAHGGDYNIFVGNDLTKPFTFLRSGQNNQSFDLNNIGSSKIRFVKIEVSNYESVFIDSIVAIYYDGPDFGSIVPKIDYIADFWIWDNISTIDINWNAISTTPWNYSITINGFIIESGPWLGLDIKLEYNWEDIGKYEIKLRVTNVFGNSDNKTVGVEVREQPSITSTNTSIATEDAKKIIGFELKNSIFMTSIAISVSVIIIKNKKKKNLRLEQFSKQKSISNTKR